MAAGAAGYRQTFITFGLKEDFLEGLTAAIHAVQVVATARSGSQTSGVTATAGVKALLRRGHLALGVLHSLVKSDLSAASPLLAGWTEATRVRKPATARRAGTRIANIVVTARVASAEGEPAEDLAVAAVGRLAVAPVRAAPRLLSTGRAEGVIRRVARVLGLERRAG